MKRRPVFARGSRRASYSIARATPDHRNLCQAAAEVALIEKYRSLAKSLGARRVVFATLVKSWGRTTVEKIFEVLADAPLDVWLLTSVDLFEV